MEHGLKERAGIEGRGSTAATPFTKQQYLDVRSGLRFKPDLLIGLLVLIPNTALVAMGVWLLQCHTVGSYIASQLLFPLAFFQAFSILHDCGHGSYAPKPWQNALIGHYASVLCFLPFFPWKYTHALHHAWVGN